MKFYLFLVVCLVLSACASVPDSTGSIDLANNTSDVQTPYYNLTTDINNLRYSGVGVLPIASDYKITVHPTDSIARIVWTTCHQSHPIDRPDTGWLDNAYTFDFKIDPGIEDVTSCPLEIKIATENADENSSIFEFLDKRPEANIVAQLKCNGDFYSWPGVSICQSVQNTRQQIIFAEPVRVPPVPNCAPMINTSGDLKVYDFTLGAGICTYYFTANSRAKNGKRQWHRMKTIGYTYLPTLGQKKMLTPKRKLKRKANK